MSDNIFDTSDLPFIVLLDGTTDVCYGPLSALDAMAFCDRWNTFLADRNLPGTWRAIPLAKP